MDIGFYLDLCEHAYNVVEMVVTGYLHIEGSAADAVAVTAAFAVMCFIDRRNIRQKVFLAVIMYLIIRIAGGIEGFIMNRLYNIVFFSPFVTTRLVLQTVLHILVMLADVGLLFLVMLALFHIVDKTYSYKKENMQSRELRLFLAPLLTVIAGNMILRFFLIFI